MILGIIQARAGSSRLPGKGLAPILGRPMTAVQLERVARARLLDKIVVATPDEPADAVFGPLCEAAGVDWMRGPLADVLDRFHLVAERYAPDHVVRLTGDCPLTDPDVIDAAVRLHLEGDYDYTRNVAPPTFPDGLDVEVMTTAVLQAAWREADRTAQREHVTLWVREHPERFAIGNLTHSPDLSALRWTVDEEADLGFVRAVYEALYPAEPDFRMADILALIARRPELLDTNQGIARDEGLAKSLRDDAPAPCVVVGVGDHDLVAIGSEASKGLE